MAEPTENAEATEATEPTEPSEVAEPRPRTDWKAEARKWEERAKRSEQSLRDLRAKGEREGAVRAAADAHGVSFELLSRMEGDPEENAALLAKATGGKAYPQTRDSGDPSGANRPDPMREAARALFGGRRTNQ